MHGTENRDALDLQNSFLALCYCEEWAVLMSSCKHSSSVHPLTHALAPLNRRQESVPLAGWADFGADLDTHRYTHCERNSKVLPRASTLQSNSENRFWIFCLIRGCLSTTFCIFSFDPSSGRFENGGTAFGSDRYAVERAGERRGWLSIKGLRWQRVPSDTLVYAQPSAKKDETNCRQVAKIFKGVQEAKGGCSIQFAP
jgi:hypothetical protein